MTTESLQNQLQQEFEKMAALQKEIQKPLNAKVVLEGQMSENQLVSDELDLLDDDCPVFKLTGPVLVPYDKDEAKQNVEKRMDYIGSEIVRINNLVADLMKKQKEQQALLSKLEQKFKAAANPQLASIA